MRYWLIAMVLVVLLSPGGAAAAAELDRQAGIAFDWERAVSLYKQGRYQEAIREFEQVLSEHPDHPDSLKYTGLAWFQLKEYQRSIEPLGRSLQLKQREGRNDPELIRALGLAWISLGRYEEALPFLETITRLQLDNAANHYLLGVAFANLNRDEDAIFALRRSLQLNPRDTDTIHYLAGRLFQTGRLREAIGLLRRGLAIDPRKPELLGLLAESSLRNGASAGDEKLAQADFNEAVRAAKALTTIRNDGSTLELLGRAYLAAKNYPLAESTLMRAFELTPSPGAALCFNLGFAHARTKSWNRAVERLVQADRLVPNDVNTLYYLGYVYENLRRYQPALEAYTRAWDLGGRSNPELKTSIDRVSVLTGNL
ncbi:MAG: tetratricopeptide repeat protein [Blastocatellia bacterium]